MVLKYSEALCELTASTRHSGKHIRFSEALGPVETLRILIVNVKSLPVLVKREFMHKVLRCTLSSIARGAPHHIMMRLSGSVAVLLLEVLEQCSEFANLQEV